MKNEGVNVYVASGNYQVFSAVCHRIVDCPQGHAVLLCFTFENSDYICNKIESSGIFDSVYQLTLYNNYFVRKFSPDFFNRYYKEVYIYIRAFKKIVREFNKINNIYACDSYRPLKPIFIKFKNKYSTKIHYIEGDIFNRHNFRDYHLEYELYDILDDQYFFRPQMVKHGLPIPVIEQGKPNEASYSKILSSFGYSDKMDDLSNYRLLFFVAGYRGALADLDAIEHCICRKLSRFDGFACKRHPNYTISDYSDIQNYSSRYPWEVSIVGNLDTIESKLLIGNQTGAMFHPKYVFDKEPYLIFTYKLYHPEPTILTNDYESMSAPLIETYRNPSKILVPETEEEMFDFIEHFLRTEYKN